MNEPRFAGQVAVVTGGGSGIGRATVERLASEGATVIVAEFAATKGEEAAGAIERKGGRALFVETDVADSNSVDEMMKQVIDRFGRLDVLVNNAGNIRFATASETTDEAWRSLIDTHLSGVFNCSRAAFPHMAQAGKGVIINVASVHAFATGAGAGPYAAAKGGIVSFTRALAIEGGPLGVRAVAVCPGSTDTPLFRSDIGRSEAPLQQAIAEYAQTIPLRRVAAPSEIAAAIAFLASDDASYVTGVPLVVDGGLTCQI